jgi:non-specific protein-tyrosine kinase
MELKQFASVIWKWAWLILVSTLIGGAVSYYVSIQQPKVYQATTQLLVGQSIENTNPVASDIFTSSQLALTYTQLVKTSVVLRGTIDALGVNMTVDQLRNSVTAKIIEGTQLIELRVTDTDRVRSKQLADELAHQLTLQGPAASSASLVKQREFVQEQLTELQNKIEKAHNDISDLTTAIQSTTSARDVADKQQQIQSLQTQISQWQQSYSSLIGFLSPRAPNFLSVIEPAEVPNSPIFPNIPLNVGLAAGMGFLLAVAAAFVLDYLDDTLKTPIDISRVLGLSTIGGIAAIPGTPDAKLITSRSPRSAIAEAYRVLRTNIQFSSVDKPIKSILVTSASPMEGKSVTAANTAIVMAQAGLRTVVLDCDLRRPSQHRLFGVSNDLGLTNALLSANGNVDSFMRPTRIENLRVYTTGALPPNPAELLGSERMHSLNSRLESEVDMIVIDSPPCMPVTDTAILSRMADGVILVVESGRTRRDEALRAKEVIEKAGGRILGVVLNRLKPRAGGYYYYYHNYYSHETKPQSGSRPPAPPKRPSVVSRWVTGLTRKS